MKNKTVLDIAAETVAGPRRESFGPAKESFSRIASVWSSILNKPVTPREVALCMIGLKLCREANMAHPDNRVDIAGYTLLLDELSK